MSNKNNDSVDFFSSSKLLVKNVLSVLNKVENPNIELLKEVMELVLKITEKQLQITEIVIKENYDEVVLNETLDKILVGMICVVNSKEGKKIGKVEEIKEIGGDKIYILKIVGEDKKIEVSREKFNI